MSLYPVVSLLAAVSSLLLAAAAGAHRPQRAPRVMFALGMLGFGVESLALLCLTNADRSAAATWLQVVHGLALMTPIPWALFVIALVSKPSTVTRWRLATAVGSLLALTAATAAVLQPPYQVTGVPGGGLTAGLTTIGRYGVVLQILVTVGVLGALEACLRTSSRDTRWHIKYLLLGLGGIFIVRFYFQSHTLLFNTLHSEHLVSQSATLFVGNLTIAISLLRDRLLGVDVAVSRQALYRSVVVGAAGTYLFVVGALGWLLSWLGVPETLFWVALVVFVSVLALAAVLLSDDVRWRVKRFVGRHFYRSKYDYRDQWVSFTKRLGSLLTLDELAPQLLAAVTDATGARKAALYLLDDRDGRYHMVGAVGSSRQAPTLPPDSALLAALGGGRSPVVLSPGGGHPWEGVHGPEGLTPFADVAVVVPLSWQGRLLGLILLGPERTGAAVTAEDLEFLATVSEQAAGTIVTARLSERLARSREFEAFHRLTSFVIHDVKNAVTALSMLTRNALDNFEDPEFQRDAIRTLSKTVDRMKELLGRLSSAPDVRRFQFVELDIGDLAVETATSLVDGRRVTLVYDLAQVPRVLGDPEALGRVLQNLVSNAVEAMDGDGQVTVRTTQRDGLIACSVADTGCGIPVEFMKQSLFVPFRTTKKNGWGIGLYQAHEIVTAHHGRIEVDSEEGKGTTLTMLLPPASGGTTAGAQR